MRFVNARWHPLFLHACQHKVPAWPSWHGALWHVGVPLMPAFSCSSRPLQAEILCQNELSKVYFQPLMDARSRVMAAEEEDACAKLGGGGSVAGRVPSLSVLEMLFAIEMQQSPDVLQEMLGEQAQAAAKGQVPGLGACMHDRYAAWKGHLC